MKRHLYRLFPAANAAALVAAIVHVVSLALLSASTGSEPVITAFLKYIIFESVFIAVLTYILSLVVTIPVGAALLAVVGFFRLGLIPSLLLFFVTAQFAVVAMVTYLFEGTLADVPWQYTVIAIPPIITAWYFSVYHVWKRAR